MISSEVVSQRLHHILNEFVENRIALGAVAAVSIDGIFLTVSAGISHVGRPRKIEVEDRFQVGCFTKLAIGLTALELAASNELQLDAPISHYLPEFQGGKGDQITARHLLSHTGGYRPENFADPDIRFDYDFDRLVDFLNKTEQLFTPGKVFNYVHSGSVILGEILQEVTDRSPMELISERILGGLIGRSQQNNGSADTEVQGHNYHANERQFTRADVLDLSTLWQASLLGPQMSVPEIAKLGANLIHSTECTQVSPGTKDATFEALFRPVITLPQLTSAGRSEETPAAFTTGCARYRTGLFGLSGAIAGQVCGLRMDRERGITIAVGLNSYQPYMRDRLLNRIHSVLMLPKHLYATDMELEDLVGNYAGMLDPTWSIALENGKAILRPAHQRETMRNQNFGIVLQKDGDGRIVPTIEGRSESIGFFRDPDTGTPCFMFGTSTFKKL